MMKEEIQKEEKSEKKSLLKRLDAFFDRNYAMIFAPVFVMVLYMVGLWIYGVYPFGDEYTAASYDLSAQICPFIEHLFDVFEGKSTLTYTYAIVGGADVTGTFLYFFISPFSFLFLIFGDGMVAHASSIVMTAKLMAVAFAGSWFAKKMFKGIPDYLCVAIGVVYTYCGYMFVANTYINWVDFLVYMPFCAYAFRHFVKTGKFLPFSILVSCCIYTCFSIACFSLFTVFPALVAYGLICVEKEKRNKFIAYLCLSFVVAVLIALPVLLPALAAFTNSARVGSLFENFWYGFKTVSEETGIPTSFDSSAFINSYAQSLYRKWSYIICDAVFVALTVVWFIRRGLKDPFAKFMLIAGIMTLLPLLVDEAMLLMNMGSYMSYALRFGFLNALYFLGGACLAIEGWCFDKNCAFDGTPLYRPLKETENFEIPTEEADEGGRCEIIERNSPEKHNLRVRVCTGILIALGALAVVLIALFTINRGYKTFWSWFIGDMELLDSLNSFASRFAHSLGGAEVLVVLFVIVALVTIVGCLLVSLKKVSPRVLSLVLVFVVGVQVIFYNNQLVLGNRSTQHVKLGDYQTLCEQLNEQDDGYFRVKDYEDDLTACAPFTGETNSFSVFSSVIDEDNFTAFQLFGYMGNGKNTFKSAHNSSKGNRREEFGDAFLGYKYFFVPESECEEVEKKSYVKKVMVTGEDGKETHLSSGGYYIYENTIVFPLGYRVDSGEFRFTHENTNNSTNRLYNQAALYEFLRGEELETFTGVEYVTVESATELSEYLWDKAAEVEVGAGTITATVTAEAGESLFLNFVASKGYSVTVNGKEAELVENDLHFLAVDLEEGENVVVFTYSSPYVKYMALGAAAGLVMLCAAAFVLKKTKIAEKIAPVISWAGITIATAVVAFFMLYPTCAFVVKLFALLL